jgi:ankyrin repeat protein
MAVSEALDARMGAVAIRFVGRLSRCSILSVLVLSMTLPVCAQTTTSGTRSRAVPAAEDPAIAQAEMAVRARNFKRAVTIWKAAAARGIPEAAYRLGVAYRSGLAGEKNLDKAAHWFGAAAKGGNPDAQFALGIFHQNGMGVPQDRDEAIRLFGLAARGGNRKAGEHLHRLRNNGTNAYMTANARILANRADPREALAQAIRAGDSGSAREALARGAPINGARADRQHWRPLIFAIDRGNVEMVRMLLEQGADADIRSRAGEPALIVAIRTRQQALVRSLLEGGASPGALAVSGYSPLMEAARLGDTHLVRDLVASGADSKQVLGDGTSAAEIARRFGNESLSRELRRRGAPLLGATDPAARLADLEQRSGPGADAGPSLPPVVEAARRGDVELIQEMIDRRRDLTVQDSEGENALTRAADAGKADALGLLLSTDLDPDQPGREGATALMRAMASQREGADRALEILLDARADPHARDDSGRAVIDYAAWGATKRKIELLQGAGGSWTPRGIRTVLGEATAAGRVQVVEALLPFVSGSGGRADAVCRATEQGHHEILDLLTSRPIALDGDCGGGRTALTVAAHHGDGGLVRKLIAAGANPDGGPEQHDTALIVAAARGHVELVKGFLRNGVDVNRRGARRMTALMAAALNGHAEVAEILLKAGASRGMRSETKQTALDLAQQSKNTETAELIESFRPGWRNWFGATTN